MGKRILIFLCFFCFFLTGVCAQPTADFKVNKKSDCSPLLVKFTDLSSGNISSYLWRFGNGNTSAKKDPQAQYVTPGKYTVTLIVTNQNGQKDTLTKKDLIEVYSKPDAGFSLSPEKGCAPLTVNFNNQSKKGSGAISTYTWDFGDGNVSNKVNPDHQYNDPGNYSVSLNIKDKHGCEDNVVKQNVVSVSQKPYVAFSAQDTVACNPPLTTHFKEKAKSNTSGGLSFQWHFGDGKTSSKKNPNHTYQTNDQFNVRLTVTDSMGCQNALLKSNYVRTNKVLDSFKYDLNISATRRKGCKTPFSTQFNVNGQTSSIKSWFWKFGDRNVSNDKAPYHTYFNTGSYDITLKVTDQKGCVQKNSILDFIQIKKPEARFKVSPRKGCKPLGTQFTDISSSFDPITQFEWHTGDGSTLNGANPQYTYQDSGVFYPELIITTKNGCKDSISPLPVEVGVKTQPDFTVNERVGCLKHRVRFTNFTNRSSPKADKFAWHYGDGSLPDSFENPHHTYDVKPDSLPVTLEAIHNGCVDTKTKKDYIVIQPPYSDFGIKNDSCIDRRVQFVDSSIGADSLKWIFSDDSVSFKENPVHVFPDQKKVGAKLITWNYSTGCVDTNTKQYEPFNAELKALSSGGCAPKVVKGKAEASRNANFHWTFGNGDYATGQKVNTSYEKPGIYDVKLVAVSTKKRCKDTIKKADAVEINGNFVDLSVSRKQGCLPFTTSFSTTVKPSGSVETEYLLTGDGNRIENPSGIEKYTYQKAPENRSEWFKARYLVKDSAGCENSKVVKVRPSEPRPEIAISKSPYCDSITYHFKAGLVDSNGVLPLSHQWKFPNTGKQSTRPVIDKNFDETENFPLSLTFEDSLGCKATRKKEIQFKAKNLRAGFSSDTTYGNCPPLEVNFFDNSEAGYAPIKKWNWSFGDNSYATNQNPQKLYFLPGEYGVTLTVTDSIGCKASVNAEKFIVLDGPLATYDFGPLTGCDPHMVNFNAETEGASKVQWDLGDGNVVRGRKVQHQYKRSSTFIPRLILSDSSGCTYALPPQDTIRVKPSPDARFSVRNRCFGYPTYFRDSSLANASSKKWVKWFLKNDSLKKKGEQVSHVFQSPGKYRLKQVVKNSGGCYDTLKQKVKIGGLDARFTVSDSTACIQERIQFKDNTLADTTIATRNWLFGDNDASSKKAPKKSYKNKGKYDVELTVTDVMGCQDSLFKPDFVGVGDKSKPRAPEIKRVTVLDNQRVLLEFGKYEDFDVERYVIYRKKHGGLFQPIDSIPYRADTSYVDSQLNTLRNAYCYKIQVESFCHKLSSLDSSEAHCTIELTAKPDTNRAVLNWSPYQGWDQIKRYRIFRSKGGEPTNFQLIGNVPGDSTFYIDSQIVCYQKHYYKVKAVQSKRNAHVSRSDTSGAKPVYIPNVPTNRIIRATVKHNSYNRVEWTNPENTGVYQYFLTRITPNARDKHFNKVLEGNKLFWRDSHVDVKAHSYHYRVRVMDSCRDLGGYSNQGKTILLGVELNEQFRPKLSWTPYKKWAKGVDYYRIQIRRSGEFQTISKTSSGKDTAFTDNITDLNSMDEYRYRVQAVKKGDSEIISTSNEAVAEEKSRLYVPNVFSPNDDSHNETFKPVGLYIKDYHMKIYDRWGELIFETKNLNEGWDGTHNGNTAQDGVYIYEIKAIGLDNKIHNVHGDLTLIK